MQSELKIIRHAAADIDDTRKSIMDQVKLLHEKSDSLSNMESDALEQHNEFSKEHKKLLRQHYDLEQNVELLHTLKKMRVASIQDLEEMVKKEKEELH